MRLQLAVIAVVGLLLPGCPKSECDRLMQHLCPDSSKVCLDVERMSLKMRLADGERITEEHCKDALEEALNPPPDDPTPIPERLDKLARDIDLPPSR